VNWFEEDPEDEIVKETLSWWKIVLEKRECGAANECARDVKRERERETRSQEEKGSTMTTCVSGATIRCICRLGCIL
jgi:hypothetical protein